jgi:phosphomannomutase
MNQQFSYDNIYKIITIQCPGGIMNREFENAASCWRAILDDVSSNRNLLSEIRKFSYKNNAPVRVVFGTSGWRGEIGTDYTFNNVRIVTSAIIEMFIEGDPGVMKAMGVSGYDEIKKRGVIVGHDNRFLGPEFAMEVLGLLQKNGIKAWYAGEAVTPEFSTAIELLGASCSINLTPSHNPANYGGFKFNPSDGGPAGPEITAMIEGIANRMMEQSPVMEKTEADKIDRIAPTDLYIKYIKARKTLDLEKIRNFINTQDCFICVDNVHGATRNRVQRIIGESGKIQYLRTEDDVLFGGIAPEPSETNMKGVEKALRNSRAAFRLGIIMDPDGDRVRFADSNIQIPMNYFGAMALHFLHVHKGFKGVAAKSVGTSNLVNAICLKLGIPVKETRVGFKNFRPYMTAGADDRAIVCFEESDGISGFNHTLEKDAIFGLLLSIEMIAVTGKNISDYLKDIMDEFGYYYPDRSGIEVDRSLTGEILSGKLNSIRDKYPEGSMLSINGKDRTVKEVITVDGTKLVFDDGSWLMIRPSGTEPKVRFYIEARSEKEKEAVFSKAEQLTREALAL